MSENRARHMFPGGNTSLGFFSYYDHILPQEQASRIYVIKGGPGTGKSRFMKTIAHEMLSRGYRVEFMHCSSDSNSLDAILIQDLKVAMMDGTAPHVIDPKHPGAVDEILNFGAFWNEEGIKNHKKEIFEDSREISRLFSRAYGYLGAAHGIYQQSASIYARALERGKLNRMILSLEKELFADADSTGEPGRERSLFASAITPEGYVNYLDSLLNLGTVYQIRGDMGSGEEEILVRLRNRALTCGYDVEGFYCALNPRKLEHLIIPGLDAAITTSNSYHHCSTGATRTIDMMDLMDPGLLKRHQSELEENRTVFDGVMSVALGSIRQAKENHDRLEKYYIPYMDFKAMDACCQEILHRLTEKGSEQ